MSASEFPIGTPVTPRGMIKSFLAGQRLGMATRSLESKIRKIVDLMEGHKENDLPPGHRYYKSLRDQAEYAIHDYQQTLVKLGFHKPTYDDITVGIPMMTEVEALAEGYASKSMTAQIAAGVPIGVAVMAVGGTALFTLCQVMHHYLIHWLVR